MLTKIIGAPFGDEKSAKAALTQCRKAYRVALRGAVVIEDTMDLLFYVHLPIGGTGNSVAEWASFLRSLRPATNDLSDRLVITNEDHLIFRAKTSVAEQGRYLAADRHAQVQMRALSSTLKDAFPATRAGLGLSASEWHYAFVHPRGEQSAPRSGCACCAAEMLAEKRRAWTGGERPVKYLACAPIERRLRSLLFRRDMRARGARWGELSLEHARACYVGAKYDAHETMIVGGAR